MKKLLGIVVLSLLWCNVGNAGTYGKGELKLSQATADYFIQYLKGGSSKSPMVFVVTNDGTWATYWYCPAGRSNCSSGSTTQFIKICERESDQDCSVFAKSRTVKWKNGINPGKGKESKFNSKWSDEEIYAKLTELGFLGETNTTTKIEKKKEETKKTVKKYELKGERSIALSWEGYDDLIAGTVEFDETDYRGTLNLPLPNNDGTCDGTYSLQEGGKGTWQIACTNDMGAAGTLKWKKDGGVTGTGRDHNDKRVKFTVSKNR
jgi:hypothetical protein